MALNNLLVEEAQIVVGFPPVDMAAAVNNGDWVSLKAYDRCTIIFVKAAGTAGDDPVLTLSQAQDVNGTGAKPLPFTRIDVKQGVQTAIGAFTAIPIASGNTYTELTSAEAQALWVAEVQSEQLDVNNNFDCVRATVPDVGVGPQVGCLLYLLRGARYGMTPLPSAIID